MITIRPVYILGAAILLYLGWDIRLILRIVWLGVIIAIIGIILLHQGARILNALYDIVYRALANIITNTIWPWIQGCFDKVQQFTTETSTAIHSLTTFVIKDIRTAVIEIGALIKMIFTSVTQWLEGIIKGEPDEGNKDAPDTANQRYLFLLSLKHGRSFEAIRYELGGQPNPEANFLDWESKVPQGENLPQPECFIRHFAICLLPQLVWDSDQMSLRAKFQSATFWELLGPGLREWEGDAVGWSEEKIESIDGVLKIGVTSVSNEDVSERYYVPLYQRWTVYDVVWWNCFDFAIRLAYMLMHDDYDSTVLLRKLLHDMCLSRIQDVYRVIDNNPYTRFNSWLRGGPMLLVAGAASNILSFGVVMAGPLLFTLGHGLAANWKHKRIATKILPEWIQRDQQLVDRFDILQGLSVELTGTQTE
ncbi:hypothetical protein BDW59DRAFT_160808 [Aspergillus cavernicola]|uniref:Uncharacterized protein n=1 Tax=Aspergillus cavernicola TaxID=176166 RepID=A0ABR4IIG7_9EURO